MTARHKFGHPLRPYNDEAIDLIRFIVADARRSGGKYLDVFERVAARMAMTVKRVRTLFYGNEDCRIDEAEWVQIRERAAAILFAEAEELRRRAAQYERKAIELRYQQETLFGDETPCSPGGLRAA